MPRAMTAYMVYYTHTREFLRGFQHSIYTYKDIRSFLAYRLALRKITKSSLIASLSPRRTVARTASANTQHIHSHIPIADTDARLMLPACTYVYRSVWEFLLSYILSLVHIQLAGSRAREASTRGACARARALKVEFFSWLKYIPARESCALS